MNLKIRAVAPIAAAAMVLALGACSSGPAPTASPTENNEPVTIRAMWWGADSRNAATVAALKLYSDAHPNVTIESVYQPFSGYFDKMGTLAASGDMPDIVQFSYAYFPQYVANNQLLELDQFGPTTLDLSGLDAGVVKQGMVDGKRYAISAGANTQAVLYDPAVFTAAKVDVPKPGWTWDDYSKTMAALVGSGAIKYGSNDFSGSDQMADFWFTQNGKSFYTASGELGFTASDLEDYWNFFGGLRDKGLIPPADVTAATTGDVATYPIVTGAAAMDFAFSTLLPGVSSTAGRDLGLLPYPSGKQPGQYLLGTGITWAAAASTKHPEVVADILNFLVNDPGAVATLALERGVPVTAKAREIVSKDLKPAQKAMVAFIDQTASGPLASESVFYNAPPKAAGEITGIFKTATQSVQFGQASAKDAAAAFIAQAKDALARAN